MMASILSGVGVCVCVCVCVCVYIKIRGNFLYKYTENVTMNEKFPLSYFGDINQLLRSPHAVPRTHGVEKTCTRSAVF
jgi:ascorbate-specific PTS system EIIC-type component UlaA